MNQQQLADLIAAMPGRSHRRPTTFSSADGQEWVTWRRNLTTLARINTWGEQRIKDEATASFEGAAARLVGDILPLPEPVAALAAAPAVIAAAGPPQVLAVPARAAVPAVPGQTSAEFLDLLEARFLPAAQGQICRAQVGQARQAPTETVMAWHSRLRELYMRAFPGEDIEASPHITERFMVCLVDQAVGRYVYDQRPGTYATALVHAQNKIATECVFQGATAKPGAGGLQALTADSGDAFALARVDAIGPERNNSMDRNPAGRFTAEGRFTAGRAGGNNNDGTRRSGPAGGCWNCNGAHYARDCRRGQGQGGGQGYGRGGRGGAGGGRGGGAARGGRSANNNRSNWRGAAAGGVNDVAAGGIPELASISAVPPPFPPSPLQPAALADYSSAGN